MENIDSENFSQMVNLMYEKLPQELVDKIETWTYEMLFCPGYIYPRVSQPSALDDAPPLEIVETRQSNGVARPTLLCLSPSIYRKYHGRMLRENIWVMGAGPLTTQFLSAPMFRQRPYLHRIHLKLGIRDHGEKYADIIKLLSEDILRADELLDAESRQRLVLEANTELFITWSSKLLHVIDYEWLLEITLDLSECHSLDGGWLGGRLVALLYYSPKPLAHFIMKVVLEYRSWVYTFKRESYSNEEWWLVCHH
ncbi:MAG: hypothetical protein Q9182_002006 [Xanthomendoza sp. 2 TL-2023]